MMWIFAVITFVAILLAIAMTLDAGWTPPGVWFYSKSLPDNTTTPIATITLPTNNTGCSLVIYAIYIATDNALQTAQHSDYWNCSFANQNNVVLGACTEGMEAVVGTGCPIGCDTFPVTVAGTVATLNANYNNLQNVTGSLKWSLRATTCSALSPL